MKAKEQEKRKISEVHPLAPKGKGRKAKEQEKRKISEVHPPATKGKGKGSESPAASKKGKIRDEKGPKKKYGDWMDSSDEEASWGSAAHLSPLSSDESEPSNSCQHAKDSTTSESGEESSESVWTDSGSSSDSEAEDWPAEFGEFEAIINMNNPMYLYVPPDEIESEVNDLCVQSIDEYNTKMGENYVFVEVVEVKRILVCGYVYFITFTAKDSSDSATEFQARVWTRNHPQKPKVMYCRLKPKK